MRVFLSVIVFFIAINQTWAQNAIDGSRFQALSGMRKDTSGKNFWDEKFSKNNYVFGKIPAKFLAENYHYIPAKSSVLDMGMGEGRNAVFLATKGYSVTGVDISTIAIKKSKALALEYGVKINTIVSAMESFKPLRPFDAIICFYYVDRKLISQMITWLRPGGIIIFEAHNTQQKTLKGFEKYNDNYLLNPGELLGLFKDFTILKYEEPQHFDNFTSTIIVKKK